MLKKINIVFFLVTAIFLNAREWQISDIVIEVKGITQEKAILRVSELYQGQKFASVHDLDNAVRIAKDLLDDTRVLETVEIGYTVDLEEDDLTLVSIHILAEDSWNLIALPYPKYDSNSGFSLSIKARDYNFLGLIEALRVDFDYTYDNEDNDHEFSIGIDYGLNFPIAEHSYSLSFGQEFVYEPQDSYEDYFYMQSSVSFGTSFILPYNIYEGNRISYGPSISLSKKYNFVGMSEERQEWSLGFTHGFSLGQKSWGTNSYREGMSFYLGNSWDYDLEDGVAFKDAWGSTVSGNVQYHKDMYPLGYSGRIGFSQNIDDDQSGVGGKFRGILTDEFESRGYLYMNNALYITVWNNPKIWEIMGGPLLDIGYLWNIPEEQDRIVWSVGLDGLCYPSFSKSFQARITVGISGNGFMDSDKSGTSRITENLELFFGLGKFF